MGRAHPTWLRFMLITFYVGWKAKYTEQEIIAMVKKAHQTKGYFGINFEIFGEEQQT